MKKLSKINIYVLRLCLSFALNSGLNGAAGAAPLARLGHTAVWDGRGMLIWGGATNSDYYAVLNDGGRYNPLTAGWAVFPTSGAPAARYYHTAVWTGTRMLIWGGIGYSYFNDGGSYEPGANVWTPMATAGAPSARFQHTALWTGVEMLVWGGYGPVDVLGDGGRYNPVSNSWRSISTTGAPSPRRYHSAVWTGTEMIVWGGYGNDYLNDGARYNPATDTWTAVSTNGAPTPRYLHTAVWTGTEMIVWGGNSSAKYFNNGGRYNPATDAWTPLSTDGAPQGRYEHTAVWTGTEMLVWGGSTNGLASGSVNDGGRYNSASNSWSALSTNGAPGARTEHTAVWSGSEMLVWGGVTNALVSGPANDGGRYRPATDTWTAETVPAQPALRLARLGANVVLSWPTNAAGFALITRRDLLPTSPWTLVTNVPAVAGDQFMVTNPITNPSRYYAVFQSFGEPVLTETKLGSNLVLSWPTAAIGYVLQSTTNLSAPTTWTDVTNTPVVSGSRYYVTNPVTAGNTYYRLFK